MLCIHLCMLLFSTSLLSSDLPGPFALLPTLLLTRDSSVNPDLRLWHNYDSITIKSLSCVNKTLAQSVSIARDSVLENQEFKTVCGDIIVCKQTLIFNQQGHWCLLTKERTHILFGDGTNTKIPQDQIHQWKYSSLSFELPKNNVISVPVNLSTGELVFCLLEENNKKQQSASYIKDKQRIYVVMPTRSTVHRLYLNSCCLENKELFKFKKTLAKIAEVQRWTSENYTSISNKNTTKSEMKNKKTGIVSSWVHYPVTIDTENRVISPVTICYFTLLITSPLLPQEWWNNIKSIHHRTATKQQLEQIAYEEELGETYLKKYIELIKPKNSQPPTNMPNKTL